jgi:hypothetical protein
VKTATVGTAAIDAPATALRSRHFRVPACLSVILLCGWVGTQPSVAAARPTKLPLIDWNCSSPGRVKPTRIVLACGDGNAVAQNLTWSKWNATSASGTGVLRQNNCVPDCAEGTFHLFTARFVLSETVTVAGRRYFTSIKVRFVGAEPGGRRTEVLTDCDVNPPTASIPRCP